MVINSISVKNVKKTKKTTLKKGQQGFDKINKAVVNKTTAKFNGKTYKCTSSFYGTNTGTNLISEKTGKDVSTMKGDLIMYTCAPTPTNLKCVRITLWTKI